MKRGRRMMTKADNGKIWMVALNMKMMICDL